MIRKLYPLLVFLGLVLVMGVHPPAKAQTQHPHPCILEVKATDNDVYLLNLQNVAFIAISGKYLTVRYPGQTYESFRMNVQPQTIRQAQIACFEYMKGEKK